MANIDDAFTIDTLSLEDNVLITSGVIDPTIGGGFEAPIGSIFLRTNGLMYQKTNTADVAWSQFSFGSASLDELVKISANDTTSDYLNGKLNVGSSLTITENNDGSNETLTIDTSIPLASIQTEIDNIEAASGGVFDTDGNFDSAIVDTALQSVVTPTDLLDTLNQMDTAIFGSVPITDLATVVVSRSVPIPVALTYTDLSWDLTNVENIPSIIEHDVVNTDNIIVKETGLYLVAFSLSIDANALEAIYDIRIRINDTTVMSGSIRQISEDDEINDVSNCLTVELIANDFLTLQVQSNGTGDVLGATSNMMVTRLKGVKGDKGDAGLTGSGSNVNVLDDGTAVPNTPHANLNFRNNFTLTDNAGTVDIDVDYPVFGTEYFRAESLGLTTSTSTAFLNKTTLTVNNLVGGVYRIGVSYGWNHNNASNDFESRIQENNVNIVEIHKQEPKDPQGNFGNSGTSQRHYIDRIIYRTLLPATSYTYDLDFRTDANGTASGIWEAIIEFWRVE